MAKNYEQFLTTDQNTPQTKHRKNLMSSKKNNNRAIHANFSSCRYQVDEARRNPIKNSKK